MTVVFKDLMGCLQIKADDFGVYFRDGYAEFSDDDGHEYQVPVEDLIAIRME